MRKLSDGRTLRFPGWKGKGHGCTYSSHALLWRPPSASASSTSHAFSPVLVAKEERRGEPTSSVRSAWPKKEDQVTIVVVGGGDVGLTHTHIHIPEEQKEEEKTRRGELLCLLPFQPVHILVETEEEEEERLLPLKSPGLIGWHRGEARKLQVRKVLNSWMQTFIAPVFRVEPSLELAWVVIGSSWGPWGKQLNAQKKRLFFVPGRRSLATKNTQRRKMGT